MDVFRKALIFISAPVLGLLVPPLLLGLVSTSGASGTLVPPVAWILLALALVLPAALAFIWARIVYPKIKYGFEEDYQNKWEKGELMVLSSALISLWALGYFYRPCMFRMEPLCRGVFPATDLLMSGVLENGLGFTESDQRASAVLGSFLGLVITFTMILDEIFSRMFFFYKHRQEY